MFGRAALVGLACLVGVAACGGGGPVVTGTPGCSEGVKPLPVANIGPDLTLRGTCGGVARGAVASVSETAGGLLNWSARITGDPSFTLEMFDFTSCASSLPQIALVRFAPPLSAKPGDAFEGVVTISASHDDFPTGTVKVHGQVERPVVTVDHPAIDFGDVAADLSKAVTLSFRNESGAPVYVVSPTVDPRLPFTPGLSTIDLDPGGVMQNAVSVHPFAVGDYSTTYVWVTTSAPSALLPDGCTGTVTTSLHVRVVPPDGGVDGPTD